MKLTKTVFALCCLFCFEMSPAHAATLHAVKGVVITPEGTVVPEFTVVVKHVTDKPELVQRKHFKHGEFGLDRLNPTKYQVQISSPQFITTNIVFDFKSKSRDTDYCIVILHPYRNEARLAPGAAYTVSAKSFQEKIPDAAREAYSRGVEFHREGQLEQALVEYGKALRNYPTFVPALTDIGSILLLYNRPEGALTFLRRAQEADKDNTIVRMNIAVALTELGNYGEALKMLKLLLHDEPRMAAAQYFVAKIEYLQKKYDRAEQDVQQALENDPRLLDAWVLFINISLEQNKQDQVREALQRIRETMDNQLVTKFIDEQLSALGS
jgi:tetratricopeptide (TPR) repeat protein